MFIQNNTCNVWKSTVVCGLCVQSECRVSPCTNEPWFMGVKYDLQYSCWGGRWGTCNHDS